MTRKEALRLRAIVEQAAASLDDKTASTAGMLFPRLRRDGALVKAGTRINWNGTLKRAAVNLWDTPENNPDNAPTLWAGLLYKNGYRIIHETITVAEAFSECEYGYRCDVLYRSKVDSNVYTPEQYPSNWEKVE